MVHGNRSSLPHLHRAKAATISSMSLLRLLTVPLLTMSLPTTRLVQKVSSTRFRFRLTSPPGGLNAHVRTSAMQCMCGWTCQRMHESRASCFTDPRHCLLDKAPSKSFLQSDVLHNALHNVAHNALHIAVRAHLHNPVLHALHDNLHSPKWHDCPASAWLVRLKCGLHYNLKAHLGICP